MPDHRRIVRCADCGHLFAAQWDVEALGTFYRQAYYTSPDDPAIGRWVEMNQPVWDGCCHDLSQYWDGRGKLLDVGAGSGGFLMAVRGRYEHCLLHAVESQPSALAFLRNHIPGLEIVCDSAESLSDVSGSFEVIALLQVLEHLADPMAVLKQIRRLLSPGGVLMVTVPNRDSYLVRRDGMRREVLCFGNPTHLQFFNRRSLESLFHHAGFDWCVRQTSAGNSDKKFPLRQIQTLLRRWGISSELRYFAGVKK